MPECDAGNAHTPRKVLAAGRVHIVCGQMVCGCLHSPLGLPPHTLPPDLQPVVPLSTATNNNVGGHTISTKHRLVCLHGFTAKRPGLCPPSREKMAVTCQAHRNN